MNQRKYAVDGNNRLVVKQLVEKQTLVGPGHLFYNRLVTDAKGRRALCQITTIRGGYVYWKPAGSPKQTRGKSCFSIAEAVRMMADEEDSKL